MAVALVRLVPDSFADALVMGERPRIDIARARVQHEAYCVMLRAAGYEVRVIAADEAHPDCPFVEDTAVVLDSVAVVTRPGAPQRRGEVVAVAEELGRVMPVRTVDGPGTVDGGDVLRMGDKLYVGRSSRTNEAGIQQLSEFAAEDGLQVVAVPVRHVLHLKSAVAQLDEETVLLARDCVDASAFAGYRLIDKAPGEAHLASVLRLGSGRLVTTTTAPQTRQRLLDNGFAADVIDSTEFQAADGGLTCLSILVDTTPW